MLCPGSRNAPLSFALAADPRVRLHTRIDERTAGFLALGLARGSRRPVAVVTTSGTAAANLHPAVLEAAHAGVTLVPVTADRPARLRGTGANQTTDQVRLYGDAASFADLDHPDPDALAAAWHPGGPIHLNVQLDDPLIPEPDSPGRSGPSDRRVEGPNASWTIRIWSQPCSPRGSGPWWWRGTTRGPRRDSWPSRPGGRCWPSRAVGRGRARTRSAATACCSVRRSASASSGPWSSGTPPCRGRCCGCSRARTSRWSRCRSAGRWPARPFPVDAEHPAVRAEADDPGWLEEWRTADRELSGRIDAFVREQPELTPYDVAAAVDAANPPGGLLVVGASNPIRDLDLMAGAHPVGERRMVLANRGLAGIDGTLSSAIGAALARPRSTRAIAYVGDVTFLHDATALFLGPDEPRPDLTIVVANDDGGSIFATLEQGAPAHADRFEQLFGTPHHVDLASLCAASRTPHWRVDSRAELEHALAAPNGGIEVVEAVIRRDNRRELDEGIRALATQEHDVRVTLVLTLVGVVVTVVIVAAVCQKLDLPTPLVLIAVGVVGSFLPFVPDIELRPEVVLFGLLPPLLYATAIQTSLVDFNANRRSILLLSVGLVAFTTAGVAVLVHLLLPDLGWGPCFAIGAVVAPPDAVAATAIGRRIGLPRRIVTILEGESLLNDATALVALRTAIVATVAWTTRGARLRGRGRRRHPGRPAVLRRHRQGQAARDRPGPGQRAELRDPVRRLHRRRGDQRLRGPQRRGRRTAARPQGADPADRAVADRGADELAQHRLPAGERRVPADRPAGPFDHRRRHRRRGLHRPDPRRLLAHPGRGDRAPAGLGVPGALPAGGPHDAAARSRRGRSPSSSAGRGCVAS